MRYLYYSFEWAIDIVDFYSMDVAAILDKAKSLNCEVKPGERGQSNNGDDTWHIAVRAFLLDSFKEFLKVCAPCSEVKDWYPITFEEWHNFGVNITGDNGEWAINTVNWARKNWKNSYDLHLRLRNEWKDYKIFRADWIINIEQIKESQPHLTFKQAERLNISLSCVNMTDADGYKILRFIAVSPSMEIFEEFAETDEVLDLDWESITPDLVPNILTFNPIKTMSANLAVVWNEGNLEASIHNRDLRNSQVE